MQNGFAGEVTGTRYINPGAGAFVLHSGTDVDQHPDTLLLNEKRGRNTDSDIPKALNCFLKAINQQKKNGSLKLVAIIIVNCLQKE